MPVPRLITLRSERLSALVTSSAPIVIGADGKLPSEVRVFTSGTNETEKGPFLFDAKAADLVMAHQAAAGSVDRMIDLEHLSLEDPETSANYDPDARAWCRLEVRDGELWLVNITWTPDGIERLTSRKQRYLSPAFPTDNDGRITKIVNIALTALPATHNAVPLVAASARRSPMDPKQLIASLAKLCPGHKLSAKAFNVLLAAADGSDPSADGADGGDGATPAAKGKWATVVQTAADAIKALQTVSKAKDPDDALNAAQAAQKAVDAFETAFAALSPGQDSDAPAAEPMAATSANGGTRTGDESGAQAATQTSIDKKTSEELVRLRAREIEFDRITREQAAQLRANEMKERRDIAAQLVTLGGLAPADVWTDASSSTPKGVYGSCSIAELKAMVTALSKRVPGNITAPPAGSATSGEVPMAQQLSKVEISEYEINRVKATHAREKLTAERCSTPGAPPARFRTEAEAIDLYREHKLQTVSGAEEHRCSNMVMRRLSRPLNQSDVMANTSGRVGQHEFTLLTSTPVQPIQEFGAASQRALEEFRLEVNATLVSLPVPWAEDIGLSLPGGSLKDTYPLAFRAIKYRESLAQNAIAVTPQSVDITVQKKLFRAAEMAHLRRLMKGDFAYIQTWQQAAQDMARARVNLRNHLVTDLLEGATAGYWGSNAVLTTGIDGQPFFSATHKVNPFDPKMQAHGSATWSNYQGTAAPLSAGNLTAEKANMIKVPGPDGEELGSRATGMLVPTCLDETARLLLTVQDIILRAGTTVDGVSNAFGAVKNEHYMSGFEYIWGPQLAGSASTANFYLYSRETIGRGLPPWVIAEDAAEEVRIWDETSEFYKNGEGWIKHESLIYVNAALLYPHGIRLISGT